MRVSGVQLFGEPPVRPRPRGGAIAAKGFRPFFLLAGAWGALAVPLWLLSLRGIARPGAYLDPTYWHAHEMVFGFASAVIAGFLLTAAANWTGRETLVGPPLLVLAGLWMAARLALVTPGLPRGLVAALDLAFLPAVALAIGRPIAASQSKRNYGIVGVLVVLSVANALMHLDVLGVLPGWRRRGAIVGVDIVITLIVVMAGRIFPMFTKNATGVATIRSSPRLDMAAIATMLAVTLTDAAGVAAEVSAIVAGAAAVLTAARAAHWGTRHSFKEPLLWILHVGYAWIPIGLALRAISQLAPAAVPSSLGTHALTAGAIGGLCLGMMARVSLGHSGRPLAASRPVAVAFGLVTAAAAVRVALPLADVRAYATALTLATVLWSLAFAIFALVYAPVFTKPRVDGKPG